MKTKILLLLALMLSLVSKAQENFCQITNVSFYCENTQLCVQVDLISEGPDEKYLIFETENGTSETQPIPAQGNITMSGCGYTAFTALTIYIGNPFTQTECTPLQIYFTPSCGMMDNDSDGVTADVDCDDQDPNTYPGAPEICDSKDNNCDGSIDEGLPTTTYYWDADLDGYGNPDLIAPNKCSHPGGRYVEVAGDCDDNDSSVHPGAEELCDGIDNDCNGQVDDNVVSADTSLSTLLLSDLLLSPEFDPDVTFYTTSACGLSSTDVLATWTNNEADVTGTGTIPLSLGTTTLEIIVTACELSRVYAVEVTISSGVTYYADSDGDGYGDSTDNGTDYCSDPGAGYSLTNDDCNDNNNSVNPGMTEILDNGVDDDCNPDTADTNDCILDSDNDGTPDCQDGCPNDRRKTEPGDCGCGNVDRDRDGDGVADCNDVCSRADDTIDVDNDGIPDCIDPCIGNQDSDADGVADCIDPCPFDPSDSCNTNTCAQGEVLICHYRNNGSTIEMCVRESQVQRHLDHGDTLGSCDVQAKQNAVNDQFIISPNPSNGKFSIAFKNQFVDFDNLTVSIRNSYGFEIYKISKVYSNQIEVDIQNRMKENGLYFVIITDGNFNISKRIIVTK